MKYQVNVPGEELLFPFNIRFFGVDLFCLGKKFLVYNLVSRNLKVKYRRSVFGVFWTLLNPLGMALVYYTIFKVIFQIQVPNYLPYVVSGFLLWAFFSQTILEGLETLVANWGVITKVPIPIQVFPFVGSVTNLVTLTLSFPVLIAVLWISGLSWALSYVLLPYFVLCLFGVAYSLSALMSMFYIYLRDLKHAMSIVMQVWFYATPVLYQESMIPEKWRWMIYANPVGAIFSGVREVLLRGGWPRIEILVVSGAWSVFFLLVLIFVNKRFSGEIVEKI